MAFGETSWWTAERDAVLRQKWAAGLSTARIGADMGCTKNAVVGRGRRLKLAPRPSPVVRRGDSPEQAAARAEATRVRREADAVLARRRELASVAGDGLPGVSRPCCWPLWGDQERPDHRYCEAPGVPGRPYCAAHHGVAFTTALPRSEAQIAADVARRMAALARGARGEVQAPRGRGA